MIFLKPPEREMLNNKKPCKIQLSGPWLSLCYSFVKQMQLFVDFCLLRKLVNPIATGCYYSCLHIQQLASIRIHLSYTRCLDTTAGILRIALALFNEAGKCTEGVRGL